MVCGFQATMAGKNFFLHFTMLLLLMIILTWCTRCPREQNLLQPEDLHDGDDDHLLLVAIRMGITFKCLETLEGCHVQSCEGSFLGNGN